MSDDTRASFTVAVFRLDERWGVALLMLGTDGFVSFGPYVHETEALLVARSVKDTIAGAGHAVSYGALETRESNN